MSQAGVTKFVLGFDRHTPHHDEQVDKIFGEFIKDFKPSIVVAGGDWQNCDQVTKFASEEGVDLKDEFAMNAEALDRFGVTHYLEGNHELRLRTKAGEVPRNQRKLFDLQENLGLKKRGIKLFPYHRSRGILKLGKLNVLHGWWTTDGLAKATAQAYDCCVFGHAHRFQSYTPKHAKNRNTGFSIGMMGQLIQPYAVSNRPDGHQQGFAWGYLHKNGHFDLNTARIIGPEVCLEGKVYARRGEQ